MALFNFSEDAFMKLDIAEQSVTANFPLYFTLQLVHFFGFSIQDNYSKERSILDLQEGTFTYRIPNHSYYVENNHSNLISQLLQARHPDDLSEIKLNNAARRELLVALQTYYALHIPEFGIMKSLPILHDILG